MSRLCGLANGVYPNPIVISGETRKRIVEGDDIESLDSIRVKGKDEQVELYGFAF